MDPKLIFGLGMMGALAPEIVRLYEIRTRPDLFTWSGFYVVISLVFSALGGVFAVALPATTYWGAIYVGISTPVLVNTALKKGLEMSKPELKGLPTAAPPRWSGAESYLRGL